MPAPLETFLHYLHNGSPTLSDELYKHYGGDDMLANLQKYDPDAKWVDTEIGGGEGGSQGMGKRLDFDVTKLPQSKLGNAALDLRPSNFTQAGLYNKNLVDDDAVYGSVTNSKNVIHKHEGIDKYAPLIGMAIAAAATMGAGALAGAPGFTSLVTGSAAGLPAGSIPGLLGGAAASAGTGGSSMWTKLVPKGPGALNSSQQGGGWQSLLGLAGSAVPYASYALALNSLLGAGRKR